MIKSTSYNNASFSFLNIVSTQNSYLKKKKYTSFQKDITKTGKINLI